MRGRDEQDRKNSIGISGRYRSTGLLALLLDCSYETSKFIDTLIRCLKRNDVVHHPTNLLDEKKLVLVLGVRKGVSVKADGVLPVLVQLLDRLGHFLIMHDDVVLLLVATVKALPDPLGVDLELGHMLGDVLVRPKDRHYVDDGVFALEVHHGDVEVNSDAGLPIGVKGQVGHQV